MFLLPQAIRAFNIKELAAKFDGDLEDEETYHMAMLSVVGVAHTLIWQFFSRTVVLSKLAEVGTLNVVNQVKVLDESWLIAVPGDLFVRKCRQ